MQLTHLTLYQIFETVLAYVEVKLVPQHQIHMFRYFILRTVLTNAMTKTLVESMISSKLPRFIFKDYKTTKRILKLLNVIQLQRIDHIQWHLSISLIEIVKHIDLLFKEANKLAEIIIYMKT